MLANLDDDITMIIERSKPDDNRWAGPLRVPHDDIGLGPAEFINEVIGPWTGTIPSDEAMQFVYTRPDGKTSRRDVTAIYSNEAPQLLFR